MRPWDSSPGELVILVSSRFQLPAKLTLLPSSFLEGICIFQRSEIRITGIRCSDPGKYEGENSGY